ncbi:hypothetical protein MSG28_001634 [Choristoneura fumiferana]|uniref:Uncharacterized protein n=1 Tax=Choristoneura fumiferana TaxID=7141 RepID=A0ACC0KUP5_CHOFU|nr:hypothetical protein MSG28_001634 [Choristoneura fumiferana]
MAPGNNERHPSHTGTIPKTKARNNCNVPQEAVTPTRRDMASNLVTTSLDWVPVSEYNTRTNYNQTRKQTNNTSDQELTDLDNSVSFESGFGRFVPVRPQPRALPLNVQNRENLTNDQHDDVAGSSMTGHTLHPYAHQMQNGLVPHSNHVNHAAAAVMIVNPTTPNALTANMSQPFNAPNQNRKNLTNNLNPTRNNFDGNHTSNNNATVPVSNSRSGTKTVNLINNMYDQGQGSLNNLNENNHVHRESARALGEAIVAACPDTAAVERRLGQIREYIRVTSSLVDTMRNSEDEAFIEHTKEEYDELVEMVMKLKESETKLEKVLTEEPDNVEVPAEEADSGAQAAPADPAGDATGIVPEMNISEDETCCEKSIIDTGVSCTKNLKKVTNLENEQLNKSLHCAKNSQEALANQDASDVCGATSDSAQPILELICDKRKPDDNNTLEIIEIESIPYGDNESKTHDRHLNEVLRKNIISCVEKVALIEEMKNKNCNSSNIEDQEIVVRPVSVQSNGSAYSENELWQNEIKNKMELSQRRLTALKQQQKRLLKYQEEAKQQLEEMNRERQSQEALPSTSLDNFGGMQSHPMNGNYNHRMYAANQIGVATTLPHSTEALQAPNTSSNANSEHGHSAHSNSQDDRFSHRDANIASSEEAGGGARDSDAEEDDALLSERGQFQKLQMATHLGSSNNTYSSSGEDSGDEEPSLNKSEGGGSIGGWSNEGSVCRVRNSLPQRHKFTNEQHSQQHLQQSQQHLQQSQQHMQQHLQPHPQHSHQHSQQHPQHSQQHPQQHSQQHVQHHPQQMKLRMETEKIVGERARIKDLISNKESSRKQKKVNEQPSSGSWGCAGPAERRQMQLRAAEAQKVAADSRTASVVNQSYNSEQEEPDSRSEQILLDSQNSRDTDNFRGGDSALGARSVNTIPSQLGSAYCSDSDSASRTKSNQRSRARRRQPQDRLSEDNNLKILSTCHIHIYHRHTGIIIKLISHSQTMERLLGTPQMAFPPSMPMNMMMPYERWRAETASHTLNNQVPPGNRANNYWDNFRSHNLLPAEFAICEQQNERGRAPVAGRRAAAPAGVPLAQRAAARAAAAQAEHRARAPAPHAPSPRRNLYERSLSFSSAPDVLNVNVDSPAPPDDPPAAAAAAPAPAPAAAASNLNLHRPDAAFRNLNIADPIPEIIQAHSNNLNTPADTKRKSSSKLPAKNSTNRRNLALDYAQSNINIAGPSHAQNPNLASTGRDVRDKAASKLFDLLRENVYSEVTALIGVNESHPDFLIQLFKELQLISSDPLRQRVLQSIRNVLSQYGAMLDGQTNDLPQDERLDAAVTTTSDAGEHEPTLPAPSACSSSMQYENGIVRFLYLKSDEICTPELLEALAAQVTNGGLDGRPIQISKKRLLDFLSKYEGMRVCNVSNDIIESLPLVVSGVSDGDESAQLAGELAESSMLQDVAGALNLFSASDPQLHPLNACPYDMWRVDVDGADRDDGGSPRSSREGKVDLINCSEMLNGDLAEADQTCRAEPRDDRAADALPDVVDTEEATPTELQYKEYKSDTKTILHSVSNCYMKSKSVRQVKLNLELPVEIPNLKLGRQYTELKHLHTICTGSSRPLRYDVKIWPTETKKLSRCFGTSYYFYDKSEPKKDAVQLQKEVQNQKSVKIETQKAPSGITVKAETDEDNVVTKVTIQKSEAPAPKAVPPVKKRLLIDFSASYTERNFITPMRAMTEYLLKQSDLETLPKVLRRSPYEAEPPITVYYRKDVEAKAIEVWDVFTVKRRLRNYRREMSHKKEAEAEESGLKTRSGRVVLTAIGINGCNFLFKLCAWCYTGSHSLFSECIHSLADTVNQLILAYGIHKSVQMADPDHPYGYTNMRYVSSLISGVGIFCVGSGLSFYHGVTGILDPQPLHDFYWAYFVLGGAVVSEGATLMVALNAVRKGAKEADTPLYEYIMRSSDPSVNVVLMEDTAAVAGVVVAASCMAMSQYTGNPLFDAVGSILVGTLLGGVASFIILSNVGALVGRSIPQEQLDEINSVLERDFMIRAIHDVKGIDMGSNLIRYKAEVDFDGRALTRSYLEKHDLNALLEDMKKIQTIDDVEAFLLKHGENIVDMLGGEIDRIELKLRKKFPQIRHCDLEIL